MSVTVATVTYGFSVVTVRVIVVVPAVAVDVMLGTGYDSAQYDSAGLKSVKFEAYLAGMPPPQKGF